MPEVMEPQPQEREPLADAVEVAQQVLATPPGLHSGTTTPTLGTMPPLHACSSAEPPLTTHETPANSTSSWASPTPKGRCSRGNCPVPVLALNTHQPALWPGERPS